MFVFIFLCILLLFYAAHGRNKSMTSGYATMVHGLGCNPHRSTTTFAKSEMTSLMTS